MSRIMKGRAGEFVTASAHLALNVRFARLVTCRGQTQMRSDIPRATKAVRLIDRGTKGSAVMVLVPRHNDHLSTLLKVKGLLLRTW
ncbi:hypothetical protein X749_30525 [Mesorhizobium sp. LNJC391B00]|nr:hypothetical protein X749_30525 [Mesorhizobium sp. LNJC391B00]